MKKICSILFALLVPTIIFAQPTDILISEYVEGSSNNKALEFYNGTGSLIDLSAGSYSVEMYFNGSTSPGTTISLTGTVANDDVYVLADDNADAAILAVTDQTSTASFFHGDDAIVLKKGSTILDVIGQVGFDPGSEWGTGDASTQDNTIRRKAGTTVGDTDPSDAFDPSIEWDGYPNNTFDGLGSPSPLPVELSSFSAIILDEGVKLNWQTVTEVNNYGFEVERLQDYEIEKLQDWTNIGFVQGHGNSNSPKNYSFLDETVLRGKYSYRLKQIDTDGQFEYSKIIYVDLNSPAELELSQNYPNPFNPTTTIKFTLSESQNAQVKVFDLLGNEICTLFDGTAERGRLYQVEFNGADLPSGIYFYRLETEQNVENRKMLLLK